MPKQVPLQEGDPTLALAICEAIEALLAPGSFIEEIRIAPNTKVIGYLGEHRVEVKAL